MWNLNITLFLCLSFVVTLLFRLITSQRKNEKIRAFMASLPGPIAAPIIGSAYVLTGFGRRNLFDDLMGIARKYSRSRFGGLWVLGDAYLLTSDPSAFKALLNSTQNINKTEDYTFFDAHSRGIFITNDSNWYKMRKTQKPTFRTSVLESFANNFKYNIGLFLDSLHKHAVSGDTFDVCLLVHLCTIDFACDNYLDCPLEAQKKQLTCYSTNLRKSTEMIFERAFSFPMWSRVIYSLLGKQKELDDAVRPMRAITKEMIEQHVRRRLESSQNEKAVESDCPKSFMDIMVDNVVSGDVTKDQAVEEAIDMFIGGSMNIATANSWVFKMFTIRPDIQQRVYNEVIEACKGQEVTFSDLSKLEYLEMVIKETLRHYTVPFILRYLTEDLKVSDEMTIPAGVNVILISYLLHHDPEYWEKPDEFYPEHFSVENESKMEKNVFFPLAGGPRICPGSQHAMLTMKYFIANTVLRYEFYSDQKPVKDILKEEYRIIFMLYPASGFYMKVKERKPAIA